LYNIVVAQLMFIIIFWIAVEMFDSSKPFFPSIRRVHRKCKFDHIVVLFVDDFELNLVGRQLRKVFFYLFYS
jgi:hypothetical protein